MGSSNSTNHYRLSIAGASTGPSQRIEKGLKNPDRHMNFRQATGLVKIRLSRIWAIGAFECGREPKEHFSALQQTFMDRLAVAARPEGFDKAPVAIWGVQGVAVWEDDEQIERAASFEQTCEMSQGTLPLG